MNDETLNRAENVVQELHNDGVAHDLDAIMLLDILAVCGYELALGEAASRAFLRMIAEGEEA